jgi:threonine/homoserine/homoserine lactone efflux protein
VVEFLSIAILVIVTPGPDTALTVRNTLLGGRRGGVFTAVGVVLGQAIWALATAAGLAALLAASEPAFVAIRYLGAAYLVFLGAQAIVGAFRSGARASSPSRPLLSPRVAPSTALRQGLVSNLTNPKMAAFFPSLLPQFAAGAGAGFPALLALGLVFCSLTLVWLTAYAVAIARAGDALSRPGVRRALEGVTGAVLLALGLRLATERR